MELVRTCSCIPRILSWKVSDVRSRSVGRANSTEVETSDVVTSMHGSRGLCAQVGKLLEVASGRKQESDERLAFLSVESEEARRVKSVWNAGTESCKQDD